ncbi:MAG: hypothetical protein K940chlam2_01201 [Chlamydiae bacterium]|nr:hypothetical protein [Chlamydiota bacterium]
MHRLATLLIPTLFITTTTFAAQPEQDLAPLRQRVFEKELLQDNEEEGCTPMDLLSVDNELVSEENFEKLDHQMVELREVSQPDVSETGNWEWMAQENQLILAALNKEEITESQPSQESGQSSPYDNLTISAEEKMIIGRLLMTMAENNVFELLMEKKRLERWGEEIDHVHPVRFLGTVFTDPRLVHCMREIRRSSFKWNGFMEGFSERMREEATNNNLVKYVDGFAEAVKREPAELYPFFEQVDFEGLVKYLLNN